EIRRRLDPSQPTRRTEVAAEEVVEILASVRVVVRAKPPEPVAALRGIERTNASGSAAGDRPAFSSSARAVPSKAHARFSSGSPTHVPRSTPGAESGSSIHLPVNTSYPPPS